MDIRVPHLADGVESGTVVNITVNVGDQVKKDQTLIELETEKAVAAIPAPADGIVTKINVKKDDKVAVGQVIMTVSESAAGGKVSGNGHSQQAAPVAPAPVRQAAPAASSYASSPASSSAGQFRSPTPAGIPEAASPTVRKVAHELGIDLSRVRGTESGGRVVMEDLRAYILDLQAGTAAPAAPSAAPAVHGAKGAVELPDFAKWGAIEAKPMSTLRKKIAEKMAESSGTVARVTQFDDVDITNLMALKKKYDEAYVKAGTKLTMSAFATKVVVDALKKYPAFNSSLDLANERIIFKKYYHVGMAVDTEQGLIVPVIKDADKKSILEISKEIDRLAAATRDRKVAFEDLQGGTFTISNQGSLGGTHFTPVVYTPQVAILGIGRARWMPVGSKDGKVSVRFMMPMALSYDHRAVDGGNAVRFNNDLVQGFQNFDESAIALGKPAAAGKAPIQQKAKKR